ncbi:MAG: aminomethyl-transferring glycine dehydrogenase subunit GcvPA [Anaerovibrio sp.]|uniref:aminomethyl-transferring glycine dehydrogenase subunit GcvPA n=1 Tax=Anaerovibrio sp. TaxID=1872532 RepID=UPI00260DDE8A|nr:aminomethyl-transferring glycine dehydrogenase subunit GcvPA [Anaerovibrio sp.]MDD7678323.1 aminomethyl-transferring glycine dehydrogenase subunit GcvPA [Anaerovibrio sp.]MDY2603836.1 aminomethyl-transferring glycine dehydrogenase subunit GcvPA [Anaerovibrio sp.]
MGSYIPFTLQERQEMLSAIGMSSTDELYAAVPESVRLKELSIPSGCTELEVRSKLTALAGKNKVFDSIFRGAGAYHHYIPSIVKTVTSKEEFVTAYTPYQAEISQGVLQSIFEYQTEMCQLTGMDVSNASVYDGAVAAAEAVFMCQERKKQGVIVSGAVDPKVLAVIKTYCASRSVEVKVLPVADHATDMEALQSALDKTSACVYVQSPNYYGVIEDMENVVAISHEAGAKVIMGVNPIALGLLKTPGEYGVDIAVGEGQPLGMPLGFGGPYLGFMTTTSAMVRKLPGRIVGETRDANGKRCYVLTLQAREQHIRREKASSNICSNEALCAMTAAVYLAAMGPKGIRQAAVSSAAYAHYLASELCKIPGFQLMTDKPFFHEFVTTTPIPAKILEEDLAAEGILGGLPVEEGILWCCTELCTKEKIDELVRIIKAVCQEVA